MSAIITVHFTTRSSDDPVRARTSRMFSIVWRVSGPMPPGTSLNVLSVPICPERYSMFPTRTAGENGNGGGPYGVRNSGGVLRALAQPRISMARAANRTRCMIMARTGPPRTGLYERESSSSTGCHEIELPGLLHEIMAEAVMRTFVSEPVACLLIDPTRV